MNKLNKKLEAALAIARGKLCEDKKKDDLIIELNKQLLELKQELVKEVIPYGICRIFF